MADDEDDKIRRNLVAASSLTIASAWFDIPFIKLAVKALDSDAVAIPEWRLWVAGLSVFAYLLYRYRFSKEGHAYVYAVQEEVQKQLFYKVGNFVEQQAQTFARTGSEHPIFNGTLSWHLNSANEDLKKNYPQEAETAETSLRVVVTERKTEVWDMAFSIKVDHKLRTGLTVQRENHGIVLGRPSSSLSRSFKILALLHALIFSEASVRNVFPVWMATVAICIFWVRIGAAYSTIWSVG